MKFSIKDFFSICDQYFHEVFRFPSYFLISKSFLSRKSFITNNHASFYLWRKEICSIIKKSQNIMNIIVGLNI